MSWFSTPITIQSNGIELAVNGVQKYETNFTFFFSFEVCQIWIQISSTSCLNYSIIQKRLPNMTHDIIILWIVRIRLTWSPRLVMPFTLGVTNQGRTTLNQSPSCRQNRSSFTIVCASASWLLVYWPSYKTIVKSKLCIFFFQVSLDVFSAKSGY